MMSEAEQNVAAAAGVGQGEVDDGLDPATARALAGAISANRASATRLVAAGWPADHAVVYATRLAADLAENLLFGEASRATMEDAGRTAAELQI